MEDKSLEEKKKLMLAKFQAPKFNVEDCKKYHLYKKPIGTKDLFSAELVTVAGTEKEIIAELSWRLEFIKTKNTNILFKFDKRFATFENDSNTEKKFEDYKNLEFETPGEFFILEIFS